MEKYVLQSPEQVVEHLQRDWYLEMNMKINLQVQYGGAPGNTNLRYVHSICIGNKN